MGHLSQPSPVPSSCAPSASSLVGGVGWGAEKLLALGKPFSATVEASLCYQLCFQHKSKIQPHTSYCEEIEFYSRQNQHTHVQAVENMPQISKSYGLCWEGGETWISYSKLKTSAKRVRQANCIGFLRLIVLDNTGAVA